MTVSHILAVLSSSDLVTDVEVIEMNIEPKTQSLRAKATFASLGQRQANRMR